MDTSLQNSIENTLKLKLTDVSGLPGGNMPSTAPSPKFNLGNILSNNAITQDVRNLFGKSSNQDTTQTAGTPPEENQGMNPFLKWTLIISGAALVGFIVYKVVKHHEVKSAVKAGYKG